MFQFQMKLDPGRLLHFNACNTVILVFLLLLYFMCFEALFITFQSNTFIGLLLTPEKIFMQLLLHKDYNHMHSKSRQMSE